MYLRGGHKSLIHRESVNGHRFTEGYFKIRRNKIITVLVCYETFFLKFNDLFNPRSFGSLCLPSLETEWNGMRSLLWLSLIETCHAGLSACLWHVSPYSSVRTGVQWAPRDKWAHGILPEDKGVIKLGHVMAAQRSRRPKSHMVARGMD